MDTFIWKSFEECLRLRYLIRSKYKSSDEQTNIFALQEFKQQKPQIWDLRFTKLEKVDLIAITIESFPIPFLR